MLLSLGLRFICESSMAEGQFKRLCPRRRLSLPCRLTWQERQIPGTTVNASCLTRETKAALVCSDETLRWSASTDAELQKQSDRRKAARPPGDSTDREICRIAQNPSFWRPASAYSLRCTMRSSAPFPSLWSLPRGMRAGSPLGRIMRFPDTRWNYQFRE